MKIDWAEYAEEVLSYSRAIRPVEEMTPSEFAERYRNLKEGTTAKPGRWSNKYFPHLTDVMDCILEALQAGKTGVVLMKSGQSGGSEAMICVLAWLLYQFPGPILYLISTDIIAREFGKDRFSYLIRNCKPITKKALIGKGSGETIHAKRFTDGKIAIFGGGSISKLESIPYRFVFLDEVDSLKAEMNRHSTKLGDPIKTAEIRTDSYRGETLIIAFAHPTTKAGGAGKLYYEKSDQRRAFINCPHCDGEFWLSPELLKPRWVASPNRDNPGVPITGKCL